MIPLQVLLDAAELSKLRSDLHVENLTMLPTVGGRMGKSGNGSRSGGVGSRRDCLHYLAEGCAATGGLGPLLEEMQAWWARVLLNIIAARSSQRTYQRV